MSFRVTPSTAEWVRQNAKELNCTQAELIDNAVSKIQNTDASVLATQITTKSMSESMSGGGELSSSDMKMLQQLGISTASGIAGFYISKWVRKQMDLDEDKGTQIFIGLIAGLGTQILQMILSDKE